MRQLIILFIALTLSQFSFSQKNNTEVFVDALNAPQSFSKVGQTINVEGSKFGVENVVTASITLLDETGSYKASVKYKNENEIKNECFSGKETAFENIEIPVYNSTGVQTETLKKKLWKPIK